MISEIIETVNILLKEGFNKNEAILICLTNEVKHLREVLNEFNYKKL